MKIPQVCGIQCYQLAATQNSMLQNQTEIHKTLGNIFRRLDDITEGVEYVNKIGISRKRDNS